jgi:hypothetical protein
MSQTRVTAVECVGTGLSRSTSLIRHDWSNRHDAIVEATRLRRSARVGGSYSRSRAVVELSDARDSAVSRWKTESEWPARHAGGELRLAHGWRCASSWLSTIAPVRSRPFVGRPAAPGWHPTHSERNGLSMCCEAHPILRGSTLESPTACAADSNGIITARPAISFPFMTIRPSGDEFVSVSRRIRARAASGPNA